MSKLQKALEKFKSNSKEEIADAFDVFTNIDSAEPKDYISTGDDILDLYISNRPRGGVPLGRYLNIYSDSGLGKSLMVYKLIANAQKKGGIGVYYDTEGGAFKPYMRVLGVNEEELIYTHSLNTVEDIFASIINFIMSFKETGFTDPLVIAVDSMTAVTTRTGADLDTHEKKGYGTGAEKQLILNDELRKVMALIKESNILFVTTDQIRDNIGAMAFQEKTRDTSGHAQKFYADIRLQLKKKKTLKIADEKVGAEVEVTLKKSRISPPHRACKTYIYHTRGIDNYMSWVENGSDLGIIKKGKGTLKFKDKDGEEIRFDGKLPKVADFRRVLTEYPDIKNELYNQFCDRLIVQYEDITSLDLTDLDEVIAVDEDHAMSQFNSKVVGRKKQTEEAESDE